MTDHLQYEIPTSLERILLLHEKNNQQRFEAIEKQMLELRDNINKLTEGVAKQNIGLAEFRGTAKNLQNQVDDLKESNKKLTYKLDILAEGAHSNKAILQQVVKILMVVFSASVAGAVGTYWFLIRNGVQLPS